MTAECVGVAQAPQMETNTASKSRHNSRHNFTKEIPYSRLNFACIILNAIMKVKKARRSILVVYKVKVRGKFTDPDVVPLNLYHRYPLHYSVKDLGVQITLYIMAQ
jgi:hypothetical protein